jgi:hypothetical protein
VFVPGRPFQPGVVFWNKVRVEPLSGKHTSLFGPFVSYEEKRFVNEAPDYKLLKLVKPLGLLGLLITNVPAYSLLQLTAIDNIQCCKI